MEQGWAEPTIQGKPSPGLVHSTATGTAPTEPSGSGGVTSPALTDAKANAVRKHPPRTGSEAEFRPGEAGCADGHSLAA